MFIQLSVHEYFYCLHLLAIIVNATVNIIYKFLSIHKLFFFGGIYLGEEFLGHMVTLV